LAAGGFTTSAAIYIFNLKKFEPLLRPAKLSAFIGYLIFVIGLFFDLGQPWRIWHPMIMWNPHSVLFEVSWCVMLYTTVLGIDIFIMALERWQKYEWVGFFRNIYLVLVVAGVMLSTLHQSSLGALYLLLPEKMSDLWATGALGPLFFASAVVGGLSVVTLESLISAWAYKRKPEVKLLASFSKGLGIALLVYFAMKVTDLYARGATVWVFDKPHFFFYMELFGTAANVQGRPQFGNGALLGCGTIGLRSSLEPFQRQSHQLRRLPGLQLLSIRHRDHHYSGSDRRGHPDL
jgi:Ni/Fe-hydrogenase subunit HybB-like protein